MSALEGYATPEGTRRRADPHRLGEGFYRDVDGLRLSTVGMGSYLGEVDPEARDAYYASAKRALEAGITVLDTAANYRHQASERDLGAAIEEAGDRESVFVVTKGGFVHGDVDTGLEPGAYLQQRYLEEGVVDEADVVAGMHCMAPAFLRGELAASLDNLGISTVDLYMVHNPETQLDQGVSEEVVYQRLEDAFAELERQRAEGHVRSYGIATWEGLRVRPSEGPHLSLKRTLAASQRAHESVETQLDEPGFAGVQLPFNMHLTEAATARTQPVDVDGESDGHLVPALEAIDRHGLIALTSAALMQGGLLGRVTEQARELLGVDSDVAAALQFARSAPGVTTSLVGMGTPAHVDENVEALAGIDPAPKTVDELLGGIEEQQRKG